MSSKRNITYKCPYCDKRFNKENLVIHVGNKHDDMIPENYSAFRLVFDYVNKKPSGYNGKCIICGNESGWDEEKGKYNRLCSNPACKKKYIQSFEERMLRSKGVKRISSTAEGQTKMLANRKISGEYKFQDGGIKTFTGTYEKKALEFMDKVMNIKSEDVTTPGPIMEYDFDGKKHIYISDIYYVPYNLIIEVKDGGNNPNMRSMPEYRAKQIAKEKYIIKNTDFNYLRLTNNDFSQLLAVFMELKMEMSNDTPDRVIRINENVINEELPIVGYIKKIKQVKNNKKESEEKSKISEYVKQNKLDLMKFFKSNYEKQIKDIINNTIKEIYNSGKVTKYDANSNKDYIIKDFIKTVPIIKEICYDKSIFYYPSLYLNGITKNLFTKTNYYFGYIIFKEICTNVDKKFNEQDLPFKLTYSDDYPVENSLYIQYKQAFISQYKNSINESYIEEGFLKSEPDILYNKEAFDNGDINICFVIGHSGSGKSTLAHSKESDKVEVYELDDLQCIKDRFTMTDLKKYGDLIYTYFNGPGKKFYISFEELQESNIPGSEYEDKLYKEFVAYAINWAKKHKDKKYIIEGVWIFCYDENGKPYFEPSYFKDYAFYIKGTSAIKSKWRAALRDSKYDGSLEPKYKGFKRLKGFTKQFFTKNWKWYKLDEKRIQVFRDYFKNKPETVLSESVLNEASISRYKKIKIDRSLIESDPVFKHLRKDHCRGYAFYDKDKLVGFVNVEDKDGESWIQALEIMTDYRNQGLGKSILDIAVKELKANYLSVNKKNAIAISMYKKYGFKTYKETETMYFMSLKEELSEAYTGELGKIQKDPEIIDSYGFISSDGIYNENVKIKGFNKWLRGRSELLILDGDKLYLKKDPKKGYSIPGGGWEKDEDHNLSAIRETNEEARIKVKDVNYVSSYVAYFPPKDWVKEKISEENWWYGEYIELYIGEYDGQYKGKVEKIDQDKAMESGKFYDIKSIYNDLIPVHQEALSDIINEASISDYKFLDIKSNKSKALEYLKANSETKSYAEDTIKNYNGELIIYNDTMIGRILIGDKKDKGFITDFSIDEEHRGNKLGSRLLDDAINKYHGVDLVVDKSNTLAVDMYKRHGFVIVKSKNIKENKSQYYMKLKSKLDKNDKIIEEDTIMNGTSINEGLLSIIKKWNDKSLENDKIDQEKQRAKKLGLTQDQYKKYMNYKLDSEDLKKANEMFDNFRKYTLDLFKKLKSDSEFKKKVQNVYDKYTNDDSIELSKFPPLKIFDFDKIGKDGEGQIRIFDNGDDSIYYGFIYDYIKKDMKEKHKDIDFIYNTGDGDEGSIWVNVWTEKYKNYIINKIKSQSVNEAMNALLTGYIPGSVDNPNNTYIVNYMQNNVFSDEDPNEDCIGVSSDPLFTNMIIRDKNGILKRVDESFLEDKQYKVYIVEKSRDEVNNLITANIGNFVKYGYLYETLTGKKLYTKDQVGLEGVLIPVMDYYESMDTFKEICDNYFFARDKKEESINESTFIPKEVRYFNNSGLMYIDKVYTLDGYINSKSNKVLEALDITINN